MKKVLVGLIILTMVLAVFSIAILNSAQTVSFDCRWKEINSGLCGGIVKTFAVNSNNTVYAGTY